MSCFWYSVPWTLAPTRNWNSKSSMNRGCRAPVADRNPWGSTGSPSTKTATETPRGDSDGTTGTRGVTTGGYLSVDLLRHLDVSGSTTPAGTTVGPRRGPRPSPVACDTTHSDPCPCLEVSTWYRVVPSPSNLHRLGAGSVREATTGSPPVKGSGHVGVPTSTVGTRDRDLH